MGLSKNLNAYTDVEPILAEALRLGGGSFKLDSKQAAVKWRLRAYNFRKLLLDECRESYAGTGVRPSTPYDHMILRIHDDAPEVVRIEFRKPEGTFIAPSGEAVEPRPVKKQDDLLDAVEELLRNA